MTAKQQFLREPLSLAKRYSEESDISILETIEAMNDANEMIIRAALDAKEEGA